MSLLVKVKDRLWDKDPGFLRFKHAFKTIVAITLSMALCYNNSRDAVLLAGIAAGMSIQGIKAPNFKAKLGCLVVFDGCYFAVFCLGLLFKPYPHAVAVAFVTLAFFSFYIRRFGNQFNFPGLMLWLFFFMANILPLSSPHLAVNNMYGFFIGLFIAALVYLVIFPNKQRRLFIKTYNTYLHRLSRGIQLLHDYLPVKLSEEQYNQKFVLHKTQLFKMIDFNKAIVESKTFDDVDGKAAALTLIQYSLSKDLTMLYEAYHSLLIANKITNIELFSLLQQDLKALTHNLNNTRLVYAMPFRIKTGRTQLHCDSLKAIQLSKVISAPDNNNFFIALLNFNLGLQLMVKNLRLLLEVEK